MLKSIGAVLAGVALLAACSVSGPRVTMDTGKVQTKPVTVKIDGGKSHCPPGHAKKNWC